MPVLLAAPGPEPAEGLRDADWDVDADPGTAEWLRLAAGLRDGRIAGAALVAQDDEEGRRLAISRPGALVVAADAERTVVKLRRLGWDLQGDDGPLVLRPPGPGAGVIEAPMLDPGTFAAVIGGLEPAATLVDARAVELDDDGLFGCFAAGRLGGANALLSLSGARADGPQELVLRNPAALGLERADARPSSLAGLARRGLIACEARGLSRTDALDGEDEPLLAELWAASDRHTWTGYWLVLRLHAPRVDPPVWIPAGQVFEQRGRTGRQTLAAATGVGTVVAPGQAVSLLVPAVCLDPHLGSPAVDPMGVTPLRVPLPGVGLQDDVWRTRQAVRGERR
jgi:hypothetical protein